MLVIPVKRCIWDDRYVFFPSQNELEALLKESGKFSVFRVHQATFKSDDHPSLVECTTFRTAATDLRKEVETLYKELDPKSTRYEIRKAERMLSNVRIRLNDDSAYKHLFELYNAFLDVKQYAKPMPMRRFREYLPYADAWTIYYNEKPIAGHLLLHDSTTKRVRLFLSATARFEDEERRNLSGPLNRYLHWHELQHYKKIGIETYDWGGIGEQWESVVAFKLSFGGEPREEYDYLFAGAAWKAAHKLRSLLR